MPEEPDRARIEELLNELVVLVVRHGRQRWVAVADVDGHRWRMGLTLERGPVPVTQGER